MQDNRMIVNPNPTRGIKVEDQPAIKKRIFEINKKREAWKRKEYNRIRDSGRKAKISISFITHNMDDLWRNHGITDLESFERLCHYI
tara:strand:+ start:963 stop:1223 length:261 start_codon:yes stop_codon:yes gene_type:complete